MWDAVAAATAWVLKMIFARSGPQNRFFLKRAKASLNHQPSRFASVQTDLIQSVETWQQRPFALVDVGLSLTPASWRPMHKTHNYALFSSQHQAQTATPKTSRPNGPSPRPRNRPRFSAASGPPSDRPALRSIVHPCSKWPAKHNCDVVQRSLFHKTQQHQPLKTPEPSIRRIRNHKLEPASLKTKNAEDLPAASSSPTRRRGPSERDASAPD